MTLTNLQEASLKWNSCLPQKLLQAQDKLFVRTGNGFRFSQITGKGFEKCASCEKVNMEWQMEMKAALCPGKSFQKVLRGDSGKVNIQIRQKVARLTSTV